MLRYDVVPIIICNMLIAEASVLFDTKPNEKVGRIVEQWNEDWNINPEELGNYFEGDIMLDTASGRNYAGREKLWKSGIIPYVIRGPYNSTAMDIIHWAIKHLNTKTCLRFRPKRSTDVDYIQINNKDKCSSHVGRQGGMQVVKLQYPFCFSRKRRGTVLHELMHAIGIRHEHSRADRDQYVEILSQNIKTDHCGNFMKNTYSTFNDIVPYDYGSIMHYSKFAFSKNKTHLQTIRPRVTNKPKGDVLDSSRMGQREKLTSNDWALIQHIYCRKNPEKDMMPDEFPYEDAKLQSGEWRKWKNCSIN